MVMYEAHDFGKRDLEQCYKTGFKKGQEIYHDDSRGIAEYTMDKKYRNDNKKNYQDDFQYLGEIECETIRDKQLEAWHKGILDGHTEEEKKAKQGTESVLF